MCLTIPTQITLLLEGFILAFNLRLSLVLIWILLL